MRVFFAFVGIAMFALGGAGCTGVDADDDNDTDEEVGVAGSALLSASPTTVGFGGVPVGCTVSQVVTISNTSTTAVTITALRSSNGTIFPVGSFPSSIAALGSAPLTIYFAPALQQTYAGTVTIGSAGNPNFVINVGGSGYPPDPC